jgi:hypothetical protein
VSNDRTNDCANYGSASNHLSRALVRANPAPCLFPSSLWW